MHKGCYDKEQDTKKEGVTKEDRGTAEDTNKDRGQEGTDQEDACSC